MLNRSLLFSSVALILFAPYIVQADGVAKNFGAARFTLNTIETAAGNVEEAPAVQPLADGMKESAPQTMAMPSEGRGKAMSEPAVSDDTAEASPAVPTGNCDGGLAEPSHSMLSVFHTPTAITIVGADKEVHVNNLHGLLAYDGGTYTLRLVTLEAREFVPFSGASFPMRIRFDYADAKEEHVSVDVPVRIGAASLGMEKILSAKSAMPLSGDDLMPASRAYATMTDCTLVGLPIKRVVMTTPLELSEEQLSRFSKI